MSYQKNISALCCLKKQRTRLSWPRDQVPVRCAVWVLLPTGLASPGCPQDPGAAHWQGSIRAWPHAIPAWPLYTVEPSTPYAEALDLGTHPGKNWRTPLLLGTQWSPSPKSPPSQTHGCFSGFHPSSWKTRGSGEAFLVLDTWPGHLVSPGTTVQPEMLGAEEFWASVTALR